MTLIYELDLEILTMYLRAENELCRPRPSKVRAFTDTQRDGQTDSCSQANHIRQPPTRLRSEGRSSERRPAFSRQQPVYIGRHHFRRDDGVMYIPSPTRTMRSISSYADCRSSVLFQLTVMWKIEQIPLCNLPPWFEYVWFWCVVNMHWYEDFVTHLTRDAIRSRYVCYGHLVARFLCVKRSSIQDFGNCPGINFGFIRDMNFCVLSLDVEARQYSNTAHCAWLFDFTSRSLDAILVLRTCLIHRVYFTVTLSYITKYNLRKCISGGAWRAFSYHPVLDWPLKFVVTSVTIDFDVNCSPVLRRTKQFCHVSYVARDLTDHMTYLSRQWFYLLKPAVLFLK